MSCRYNEPVCVARTRGGKVSRKLFESAATCLLSVARKSMVFLAHCTSSFGWRSHWTEKSLCARKCHFKLITTSTKKERNVRDLYDCNTLLPWLFSAWKHRVLLLASQFCAPPQRLSPSNTHNLTYVAGGHSQSRGALRLRRYVRITLRFATLGKKKCSATSVAAFFVYFSRRLDFQPVFSNVPCE